MNIVHFPAIEHDESYFWKIAIPVVVATTLFTMRDTIKWWFGNAVQRRGISRRRKGRLNREAARAAKSSRRQ